jgi:hypothetical protein
MHDTALRLIPVARCGTTRHDTDGVSFELTRAFGPTRLPGVWDPFIVGQDAGLPSGGAGIRPIAHPTKRQDAASNCPQSCPQASGSRTTTARAEVRQT